MANATSIKKEFNIKKDRILSVIERDAPALFWAMKYHKNSRMEDMSFKDMAYLSSLYIMLTRSHRFVAEKSVQMGLSDMFICNSHLDALKGLTVFYVLPKYELRNRFVNNRVYKLHQRVAYYQKYIKEAQTKIHRTSMIHFGKGTLVYVGSNVESEFIEIPVDSAYVDEKDRCNLQNLALLPDRYSASPYKYHREISNPTIEDFGIDETYKESTQCLWNIKCDACGEWFSPDFFSHVVREIGYGQYIPYDPEWVEGKDLRLIHTCGAPVDRLKNGEWVAKYSNREWDGVRISKLYGKFTRLSELYNRWIKAQGNERKIQVFFNSDLGLPFSSKGAKITRQDLRRCSKMYEYPVSPGKCSGHLVMGIDVGAVLNFVIREIIRIDGIKKSRLVLANGVSTFNDVYNIIQDYKPRVVVVDAMPEIHKVMEFKKDFRNVFSSRFQNDSLRLSVNREEREVRMDRTALLDFVKGAFDLETYVIPENFEVIDNGDYVKQITASTRILEVDEEDPEKSRFIWKSSKPDHYFLAEGYCIQAEMLLPDMGIFDFFAEEAANMEQSGKFTSKVEAELTDEQKKEMDRLRMITTDSALVNIRRRFYGDENF